MPRTVRKILFLLLALGVIGVLLYESRGAISLKGFSWAELGAAVRGANVGLLLLALAAIYLCFWIRALRWVRLCRAVGPAGVWSVYAATLMGFVTIVLLGRAGELVRPLLIARRENLPAGSMLGIYVVERVFDISVTILLAGWSLVLLPGLLQVRASENSAGAGSALLPWLQRAGFTLFAGFLAAVVFLIYLRAHDGGVLARANARWHDRTGWRKRAAGVIHGFLEGLQAIRTWGDLATAVGLTAVHWVLILYIYHWILMSFGGSLAALDVRAAAIILTCAMLGSTLQIPVVGGGSQVGSWLALTAFLGVDQGPAIVAAATLWLVTFAGCTLAGIPLLLHEGMSLGELRRMTAGGGMAALEDK
jgi:glycosyltransferase 2 family protein